MPPSTLSWPSPNDDITTFQLREIGRNIHSDWDSRIDFRKAEKHSGNQPKWRGGGDPVPEAT
jgi:hypothetical protein